ncbi:hypothetical protein L6452_05568 [Arctium lappa]|uniref:Uncharacterized protein n=1 Tax=Arctium lappa TaxID=4217 RepID=A0ACB9EHT6_ARCLA|nr:hypothetical protein L6452_05568 [Arctium lappa]
MVGKTFGAGKVCAIASAERTALNEIDLNVAVTELKKELRRLVQLMVEESSIDEENGIRFMDCVEKANGIL